MAPGIPPSNLDELRRAVDRLPDPGRAPAAPVRPVALPARPGRPAATPTVSRPPARQAPATPPPSPTPIPAIQVVGLTKKYRGTPAVDGLSFTVPRGKVTAFVGPNGSGKTTTIRMLLGLVRRDGGDATVLGTSVDHPSGYLGRVGALIEAPAFEPELDGRRNLLVLAALSGTPDARVAAALDLVGLGKAGRKPYRAYSLGMRQRLGIAAALLGDPHLLILDEPTNGLDPSGIQEMRGLLRGLASSGKTVFVSSHLISEVEQLCDHLVVIREGALVYQGTPKQLTAGGRRLEDAIVALTGRSSL